MKTSSSKRWPVGIALLAMALSGSGVLFLYAGPPEFSPLRLSRNQEPRPKAADAAVRKREEPDRAYFYNGGKKVYLQDTGLAVAKLRPNVDPATLNLRPVALAFNDPLRELAQSFPQDFILTSTDGPNALDLHRPAPNIEYAMPVVETGGGRLIMTPRIAAKFRGELQTEEAVNEYVGEFGLRVRSAQTERGAFVLELAEGDVTFDRVLQAANRLHEEGTRSERVVEAYPDFIPVKKRYGFAGPGDPGFAHQWHLHNDGQGGGHAGADVRALDAWQATQGSPSIAVAIIDDSIEKDHPDLKDNFQAGRYYNGFTGDVTDDPSPKGPSQRHGTPCAGVAVAASNSVGGVGVAPGCKLIGVHFWHATISQTADAFRFCDEQGADVISCSWSWQSQTVFQSVGNVINDLAANGRGGKGTVILFAAGNECGPVADHQWFGTLPSVICVGASNWRDDHSPYANFGPEVDVVAPSDSRTCLGVRIPRDSLTIYTTDNTGASGYASGDFTGNGEDGFGGTSSATPLAAGVCALILSVDPGLTAMQVRDILISSADKIPGVTTPANYDPTTGHSLRYGYGRINASRAVELAAE